MATQESYDAAVSTHVARAPLSNALTARSDVEFAPNDGGWSRRRRLAIAAIAALLVAARTYLWFAGPIGLHGRSSDSDFAQVWFAARVLLAGGDPYTMIGPGRAFEWWNGFYYPLPAALIALPLAWLPQAVADATFAGLSAFAFAWMTTRRGLTGLLLLLSPSALFAFDSVQWSPLFTVALVYPALGALFPAKPTIGAAMFVTRPSRLALALGTALIVLSLLIQPAWPAAWWRTLHETSLVGHGTIPYFVPALLPAGALALLCLLRWRRPEARLVAALACVPQTMKLYETVPLLLVAQTPRQAVWFTISGYLYLGIVRWYVAMHPHAANEFAASSIAIVFLFYIPSAIMILRRPREFPRAGPNT